MSFSNLKTADSSRIAILLLLAVAFSLPGEFARAQAPAGAAIVYSAAGRVSLERGGELWAVSPGMTMNVGQVMVTGVDGFAEMSLPDGSRIEVFPNSRFAYRANQFSLRDAIDLFLGRIKFHIQKLTRDDPSIRVSSPTAVISVRGTVFDVEVDSSQTTRVTVDEGAVGVRHRLVPGSEVLLRAGESIEVMQGVPLAQAKPAVPRTVIGNVVRAVGNTLAQIKGQRGGPIPSAPGGGGSNPGGNGGISDSDSGSNEPAPPSGGGGGDEEPANSGPPGDRLP